MCTCDLTTEGNWLLSVMLKSGWLSSYWSLENASLTEIVIEAFNMASKKKEFGEILTHEKVKSSLYAIY